ncbi:DUF4396 domain-containing protein [Demequina lutea]|uniref:Branched-subunit amino acid ABC-type transport system permease component n=1 Tax=Demequina lutea TaxID=431489 RepID=A0A7Z0CKQ1_9MICO|nr:DUF4396 domain-containing protein [Demequina lutea]NYI41955.1 branched-subunit amino acid ABC-type transport system permease component [Demequina lutea]
MSTGFPLWMTILATASLVIAGACAAAVAVDVHRRPQPMAVMNLAFPVVTLFGSVPWALFYRRYRRAPLRLEGAGGHEGNAHHDTSHQDTPRHDTPRHDTAHAAVATEPPQWISIATSTSHCGAGCAIGDVIAEFGVALIPALAVVVGKGAFFERDMYAAWIWDFVFAFAIGIALQYFAIAPMRNQPWRRSLADAIKADTASIISWQVGMYGLMALIQLALFPHAFGGTASVFSAEFWFAMQWAMITGFAFAFPVNALLIRRGVKEAM